MEGGEASAATATPSKARRGRGVSIYDKYLNIKNNALNGEHGPSDKKSMEISNSTDEQELEAGEVVSTEENDAACANGPSGLGVSAAPVDGKRELEVEPQAQTQPQPQQVTADTPQPEVPADSAPVAEGNTALTAAATVDASTAAAPMSPSTAAFERARAPALSNPSSPSRSPPNDQYAAMRVGDPVKMINNGREMTSPRMGGPDGRNGNGDMNGGRPRSPPRGPSGHGQFDGPPRDNAHFNGPPGGPHSPRGGFGGRPGSPPRNGFGGRPGSPRGGFNGRPGGPPHGDFNGRPGSPPRGKFNGRPGSPPRGGYNRRPGSPPRGGFNGRPASPPRNGFGGGRGSPPRNSFGGGRSSPRRDGYNDPPGNDGPRGRSPPRNDFRRPPMSPGRGGPPRDFRDGPGPGRSCPRGAMGGRGPDGPGPGRGSPRGGMGGRGPGRSRSRSPPRNGNGFGPDRRMGPGSPGRMGPGSRSPPRGFGGRGPGPRSPPRDFGGRGTGPRSPPRDFGGRGPRSPPRDFDGRGPGPRSPPRDFGGHGPGPRNLPRDFGGRGPGPRSPPRDFGGRGPGGPPPFDGDRRSPMGRPSSPMRGGGFRGPSPGRDGPPNMFPARGRSRSPNRPSSADMMRKRDRSWERGGPPPDMMRRPLPDSPRMLEPRPFDAPSEWNFELKRSGKVKCRCSATSLSVGFNRQLPLYLDVMTLPHLNKSPEFLQLERPNVRRVVYELKPESMADARGYKEFVDYLIMGRGGHARAGGAAEMEPQGFKIFILPPGQAARQLGYKGDHLVAVLRSR